MPVFALNTFLSDWIIKVRVTRKYELRSWNNHKGSGEVLSLDLIDAQGCMIQGSFFNQLALRFYPRITEGNVYLVSNGSV